LRARRANDVAILWPDRRWDSEHAVIAHREKDQQRHGDHRYNWMIQHPIQTWLKDTLDDVINSLVHSVPPILAFGPRYLYQKLPYSGRKTLLREFQRFRAGHRAGPYQTMRELACHYKLLSGSMAFKVIFKKTTEHYCSFLLKPGRIYPFQDNPAIRSPSQPIKN
jgi:hypothetical protein